MFVFQTRTSEHKIMIPPPHTHMPHAHVQRISPHTLPREAAVWNLCER